MNKRIKKKRRKATVSNLQWAVATIKEWIEKVERQIEEDPAKFRELVEAADTLDPDFKRRIIEYTYTVEVKKTLK